MLEGSAKTQSAWASAGRPDDTMLAGGLRRHSTPYSCSWGFISCLLHAQGPQEMTEDLTASMTRTQPQHLQAGKSGYSGRVICVLRFQVVHREKHTHKNHALVLL